MCCMGVRLLYYIHNGNVCMYVSVAVVKLFRVGMCAALRWGLTQVIVIAVIDVFKNELCLVISFENI